MKILKFGIIIPVLTSFMFFACGEIEYVQPTGGSNRGEQPGWDGVNGQIEQEFTYHANDFPLFYLDVVLQDNGRMNAVGAPVPLLGDLRATYEVPLYKFTDDTTLTRQSSVFNQAYFSEMGIPEANLEDVIMDIAFIDVAEVNVRVVGLNDQNDVDYNINGEVRRFYIFMEWVDKVSGNTMSLDAGNLGGVSDSLNYVLKNTYSASVLSSNPNDRRLVEIFNQAISEFWDRRDVYFYAEGWTTVDYQTKMRYYFNVTGDIKFSMHLRENP